MNKPVDGAEARYLLVKRDLYYRPDNRGYTGIKSHAGRYFASDAAPDSGVAAIHEDDAPMFSPACWEDLKIGHLLSIIAEREKASAALVAENERLREALKPFAKAGELFGEPFLGGYEEGIYSPAAGPEYGFGAHALRRALTALETRNG